MITNWFHNNAKPSYLWLNDHCMPEGPMIEFYDQFPEERMMSLPKEAHVFYVGKTEYLPQYLLIDLQKLYKLKEFVIVFELPGPGQQD